MIKTRGIFSYGLLIAFIFASYIVVAQTPPIAVYDVATVDFNTTLNVPSGAPDNYTNLLDNDYDADNDNLSVSQFSVDGGVTWTNSGGTINIVNIGTIIINADGTYSFNPALDYSGYVPNIIYEITDGVFTSVGTLYLTVETNEDLFEISDVSSCNQGYTLNGEYKIRYKVTVRNKSITRGYHANSEISNIQLIDDLNTVFGDCINQIDRYQIGQTLTPDFLNGYYPFDYSLAWDDAEFDGTNADPGAQGMLNSGNVTTAKLYPRQSFTLQFCVYVDPFCNGIRPDPTVSGSGIDFDNIISGTSNKGNDSNNLIITDFHTPKTTVAANFYIPNLDNNNNIYEPVIEPDATYKYDHRVIITNDGAFTANNINYNLGLKSFDDEGVVFSFVPGSITEVSNLGININPTYDGITDTLLLTSGNSLGSGETVILNIHYDVSPIPAISTPMYFYQLKTSMTQKKLDQQGATGNLSDIDEFDAFHRGYYSYVIWEDENGEHLDRYYKASSDNELPSSNNQCQCTTLGMRLPFTLTAKLEKSSEVINVNFNGIQEHKEVKFVLRYTNTSISLQHEKIQIIDDLNLICNGNVVSVSTPTILNSTASSNPTINTNFNGLTDTEIFDGNSGIIKAAVPNGAAAEYVEVTFNVVFKDDCIGDNIANASAFDAGGRDVNVDIVDAVASVDVFSDTDNDGITDINDIDDDNDGILDLVEYNGLDPLEDADNDNIPNYRDTDFGIDSNADGIVDVFDFDLDGIPNHFDLDSDNDGITDVIEAGGLDPDNDGLVPINADGTLIIDADNDGLSDSLLVDVDGDNVPDISVDTDVVGGVLIPNIDTDNDSHVNALDIDSDNDGIVDNIEAQTSDAYTPPNVVNANGMVYNEGLIPTDTESDGLPDYLDLDSDNDARNDVIEGWDTNNDGVPETVFINTDTDNDGLVDVFDNNDTQINPTNNGQLPTDFPNVDNATTPELDWRELPAILVVIEGDSKEEGEDLVFKISLVSLNDHAILKPCTTDVNIDLFTSDGTDTTDIFDVAIAPYDYNEISNNPTTITIPSGTTTININVTTIDDTIDEIDELMTLNIKVTSGNTINLDTNTVESNVEGKAVGTIQDNDIAPDLIMNDTRENEGIDLVHTISIDNSTNTTTSSSRPIEISIAVTDITAIHPDDYSNTSPVIVTIDGTTDPDNENTSIDYAIETKLDNLNEPLEETISVIGTVIKGDVRTTDLDKLGTIIDVDPDPIISISNPTVIEGNDLQFEISLEFLNAEDVNLNIFTANGTARDIEDYIGTTTEVVIPAKQWATIISIKTIDDLLVEDIEDMNITGIITTLNTDNIEINGVGTIIDNEFPNLFSPNNDGLSDTFEIISLKQFPNFKLKIFDRWGSLVYDYNNNGNPLPIWWNGTIKGKPVSEGVYYYTIDYNDGVTKSRSGFIQLIR